MFKLQSEETEGRREKSFDYSGKVILSVQDYLSRRQQEIERLKFLECGHAWIEDSQIPGTLYSNDSVDELSGVGPETKNNCLDRVIETLTGLLNFQGNVEIIGWMYL